MCLLLDFGVNLIVQCSHRSAKSMNRVSIGKRKVVHPVHQSLITCCRSIVMSDKQKFITSNLPESVKPKAQFALRQRASHSDAIDA
jgi:hypothetical protein